MSSKKFLTELFLEALERLELASRLMFLTAMPTQDVRIPTFSKLQNELLDNWDGGEIKKAINHLSRSGFIKKKKDKYFLTAKGVGRLLEIRIKKKIENKKKTKNKYLVLIFDIPENIRHQRNSFRRKLKALGFEMIQQSVWIIQYDVLDELKRLIELYKVDDYVRFFIAEKI